MADFIAVIRRAVDGLSENTPEMREKVYDRAKSAVVRQLENMKPRPPEVMFQKQLDKLDAAIREVEAEHAEALPVEAAPEAVVVEEPKAVEPPPPAVVVAPTPIPEPVKLPEPVPAPPVHRELIPQSVLPPVGQARREEPVRTPVVAEPIVRPPVVEPSIVVAKAVEPTPFFEPAPRVEPKPFVAPQPEPVIPAYIVEAPVEPVARLQPDVHPAQLDVKPYETIPEIGLKEEVAYIPKPAAAYVAPAETVYEALALPDVVAKPIIDLKPIVESKSSNIADILIDELTARPEVKQPVVQQTRQWSIDIDQEPEAAKAEIAAPEAKPPMPKVSYDETDVVAGFNDFLKEELNRQVVQPPPQAVAKPKKQDDFSWDAPFDDLPEIKKPEAFEKALQAKQKEIAADKHIDTAKPQKVEKVSARAELEDLIGIEPAQRRQPQQQSAIDAGVLPPEITRAVSKLEGKSFKMQKKNKKAKSRLRIMPIALGVIGALVVSGGAYALWHFRDNVTQLVASIMPAQEVKKPDTVKKASTKTDTKSPIVKTEAKKVKDKDKVKDIAKVEVKQPPKDTEVASLTNDLGPVKFTQRLLADGTETITDTAKVPIDQALPEGKTVAKQTEKGKQVADTTTTTATDVKTDATDTGTPQNDAQPLGATQKMFLYEERLGQASPVAVPGTVVWKEKDDADNGKPNPTIEAQIDVPDRKITALMSIKRNTDPSLPASHIIEIVFALPPGFAEGNVDSIQRVAFKQTEQDRGNPLIAVPAKITDDFHMVALNDDADARKVNLELMKTRSWIDIPITYRNGRRGLITIEKGATGTAVFDKVMAEWAALGTQTSNNN